jgi:lysophospholipase L1-like esterase
MGAGFFADRTSQVHGWARERAARVGLVLGSCFLTLGAIETWLFFSRPPGDVPHAIASLIDRQSHVALDCYPSNPRGYFDVDLRDGAIRARYRSEQLLRVDRVSAFAPHAVELRYNSLQYRDSEVPPKRPGTRRLIVVGDSFTEGQGVKQDDTYVRVLEALLNQADPGGWEVRNWGERGADFPVLSTLFDEALQYKPDVVVYAMVLNDAERPPELDARGNYLNNTSSRRSAGEAVPSILRSHLASLIRERLDTHRLDREGRRWYRRLYGEDNREGWASTREQIERMHRSMRLRGGHFLLAAWPLLVGTDGRYPFAGIAETIRSFCLSTGIAHHDLLPALEGREPDSLWVHPLDHHPNEIAHRLAAVSLAPAVSALVAGD